MRPYDARQHRITDQDDRLQVKLEALESGTPLEAVLEAEDQELKALIKLVASIRRLPPPAMNPDPIKAPFREFINAARSKSSRKDQSLIDRVGLGTLFNRNNLKWALVPASAGVLLVIMLTFVTLFGFATRLIRQQGTQAAVLGEVQGQVQVAHGADSGIWQNAQDGDRLQSGDRVRTLEGSSATLSFYDGSLASFSPGSEIVLLRVDGEWNGVLRVALIQTAGRSSHSVERLRGDRSFYIVYTPTGTASVRGTEFNLSVDAEGVSRFTVDEGTVLVSNAVSNAYLHPGQTTHAQAGGELTPPAYAFSLEGPLTYIQDYTWEVSGVPLKVDEQALKNGAPQVGEHVSVEGHLLQDGSWVADQVSPAQITDTRASFTSVIEAIASDNLQVGSWNLVVNEDTQVDRSVDDGEVVHVSFTTLSDGRWVAQAVESLQGGGETGATSPPPTPDPDARPILKFEPNALESAACQTEFLVTGTLWNTSDETDDYAANVLLDYQVVQGVEYVDSISIDPQSWDAIQPGESRDFDVKVTLDPQAWKAAPGGTEVELRVFIAQETNDPGDQRAQIAVILISTCEQDTPTPTGTPLETATPTSTPTQTATPTVTPTPTNTATVTPTASETPEGTPPGDTNCTGANPHPTGMKLAQRYHVPYEEIMYWFCQGFGFGEIDLAYTLHLRSGLPVADIFALKSGGMGWGNIKKLLDPKPAKVPRNNKNK